MMLPMYLQRQTRATDQAAVLLGWDTTLRLSVPVLAGSKVLFIHPKLIKLVHCSKTQLDSC